MLHVGPTRAQQHENNKLSFSLSLVVVGPPPPTIQPAEVPLTEITTVELSSLAKMCPRKPSASGSHPNG